MATMILTNLLLTLAFFGIASCQSWLVTTPAPFARLLENVKMPGGNMEIVSEERCSLDDVRLTCRSLRAFVFVLEATYDGSSTQACANHVNNINLPLPLISRRIMKNGYLSNNFIDIIVNRFGDIDFRTSLNKRCSGKQHCLYNFAIDNPESAVLEPGTLHLKYACIPEVAVRKHCNVAIDVDEEGGYIKSPGYPLYYLGGSTCGWTFRTRPGRRIALTFHDLDIRDPEEDGSCIDVVRVRESGTTLYEYCGNVAGSGIVSFGNVVTLDLIASARLYPARGFLLRYQTLPCPEVQTPRGSYIVNKTSTSRTYSCKTGTVFPDTNQSRKTIRCRNGSWEESASLRPGCEATSAIILKIENENNRLSSLTGDNILGAGARVGRGQDDLVVGTREMESAQSTMMKQADYVVDIVLPTILIALLFVGNAIIVYIIFQYRKRKVPANQTAEEMALRNSNVVPQV